jgi:hypothetical protein
VNTEIDSHGIINFLLSVLMPRIKQMAQTTEITLMIKFMMMAAKTPARLDGIRKT